MWRTKTRINNGSFSWSITPKYAETTPLFEWIHRLLFSAHRLHNSVDGTVGDRQLRISRPDCESRPIQSEIRSNQDASLVSERVLLALRLSTAGLFFSYKQQKFNLLREESEGFAKTITELNQKFSMTKLTAEQLYDRLMALIGYFDIDPNRMLDLVLESFEYHLEYTQIYVDLLHLLHFDQLTLCQLIGFKFQQYQVRHVFPCRSIWNESCFCV